MNTLSYYDASGESYFSSTVSADMSAVWKRFSFFLKRGRILDFGCGSGRDSRHFLSRGYEVEAWDGSEVMCRLASAYTGLEVKQRRFEELDAVECFDGIWACASILHLERRFLPEIFLRMERALRPGGFIYASFKFGEEEGWRGERYFTCFTQRSMMAFVDKLPSLETVSIWTSSDCLRGREDEKWLNVMLKKVYLETACNQSGVDFDQDLPLRGGEGTVL